jgi:hypothetical protein
MKNKKFNPEYTNSNLGHKQIKATIIKNSIAQKGELNPFLGKRHTDETKKDAS